jgi:hypothetical protein
MITKVGLSSLWIGFIIYAFFFAPLTQPDTFELIKKLVLFNIEGINPIVVALFNLMGIWPLVYGCILFIDGRGQKIPAWPFVVASFGVGAFAILLYLALRQPNPEFPGKKDWFLQLQDSKIFGLILALGAVILLAFGLLKGDWSDFVQQWQSSKFINVMSLDFCLLSFLFPVLLKDDLTRREANAPYWFWSVTLVPLLGPLLYLCLRPSLRDLRSSVGAHCVRPGVQ